MVLSSNQFLFPVCSTILRKIHCCKNIRTSVDARTWGEPTRNKPKTSSIFWPVCRRSNCKPSSDVDNIQYEIGACSSRRSLIIQLKLPHFLNFISAWVQNVFMTVSFFFKLAFETTSFTKAEVCVSSALSCLIMSIGFSLEETVPWTESKHLYQITAFTISFLLRQEVNDLWSKICGTATPRDVTLSFLCV
jgi:hypothetical protein